MKYKTSIKNIPEAQQVIDMILWCGRNLSEENEIKATEISLHGTSLVEFDIKSEQDAVAFKLKWM